MPTETAFRVLGADPSGALERALSLSPDETIGLVESAALRGRGGAGFPLGEKMRATRTAAELAGGAAYLVANAYDADPASPLSQTLLRRSPELVVDGILIAARAVGARQAYLYLRPEAADARSAAERAIASRDGRTDVSIEIALGPGGFMGGEESALLAVLENKRAMARQRPPWPAEQGRAMRPTLVSCAETLAALPLIVRDGPDSFGGREGSRGTKLVSVTGAVVEPGVYEVSLGTTLGEIVQTAGGVTHALKAIHVGGPTCGILSSTRTGVRYDYEDLRAAGTYMGSGQVRAIPEGTCIVAEAARLFEYLSKETCAICVPCRVGTKRVGGILESVSSGLGRDDDLAWLGQLADHLSDFSLCGFGITSASIVRTTLAEFPDDYRTHIVDRRCPEGTCTPVRARRYETMAQP
ncbi:MAG: SLBB domain-containing protein [Chloroflexota bacterium]|nr:SLBB domain-containing protein [Chloroflexota bacterium]MDE3101241.1 SLBB domain-containing protein [Chloroflexota bacterium]